LLPQPLSFIQWKAPQIHRQFLVYHHSNHIFPPKQLNFFTLLICCYFADYLFVSIFHWLVLSALSFFQHLIHRQVHSHILRALNLPNFILALDFRCGRFYKTYGAKRTINSPFDHLSFTSSGKEFLHHVNFGK